MRTTFRFGSLRGVEDRLHFSALSTNTGLYKEKLNMAKENATGLYRSIHAQPRAVRELLADWDGPSRAAEKLSHTRRILLAGIGTSFHAATVGEYLLRFAGADAWAVRSFDFVHYPRPLHTDDGVIVVSHPGSKLHGMLSLQRAVESCAGTI